MKDHDRLAELAALRAELDLCENGPRRQSRAGSADKVREHIERVRRELAEDADRLDADAGDLAEKGFDGLAGVAAVHAREIRAALDADEHGGDRPESDADRFARMQARGRAMSAANESRNRADSRALHEHLGGDSEPEQQGRPKGPRKRTSAAPKPPEQT
jgi:hypothetical protein